MTKFRNVDPKNIVEHRTKKELEQEIKDRFVYFYMRPDGTYDLPSNRDGDLLKMVMSLLDV